MEVVKKMKKVLLVAFSLFMALLLLPGGMASWGDTLYIEGRITPAVVEREEDSADDSKGKDSPEDKTGDNSDDGNAEEGSTDDKKGKDSPEDKTGDNSEDGNTGEGSTDDKNGKDSSKDKSGENSDNGSTGEGSTGDGTKGVPDESTSDNGSQSDD